MIEIGDAHINDITQIKKLQLLNLKRSISPTEVIADGFVTLEYSVEKLTLMNAMMPHTVAKEGDRVIGYALNLLPNLKDEVQEVASLIHELDQLESYVIMGQICVEKDYRGRGVFRSMYQWMETKFKEEFDYIVTEVSIENKRSLKAHYAVGFTNYKERDNWKIIWKKIGA